MGILKSVGRYFRFEIPKPKDEFVLEENKMGSCKVRNSESLDEFKKGKEFKDFDKYQGNEKLLEKSISNQLDDNIDTIKEIYSIPKNSDFLTRDFNITVGDKSIRAFSVFIDGMTDRGVISQNILQPLMVFSNFNFKDNESNIEKFIMSRLIAYNQVKAVDTFKSVVGEVNFGGCAVFVDGLDHAFVCDTKRWEHRGVGSPISETVIRGPQEAFNEQIRSNTALMRKIMKDKDLIIENVSIGKRSNTPCGVMYIKDIVNETLLSEVLRRVRSIKVDYIFDSGELEQLLEDSTFMTIPQIISTERPDRVATLLAEGHVAVALDGSPFVLVMPATAAEFLHTTEDANMRYPFVNFIRAIRIIGIIIALLLPGLYIAVTNFHQEMIPTDLLFAIEASRETVPFPTVIEIILLEFSFELIREASLRIPGAIGSTLGIVGGLILGQAAVSANLVSPILIIVVAATVLGSFALPSFSMSISIRLMRFLYILLGAIAGFLGISLGLIINLLLLASAKSFGVPFLAPLGPVTKDRVADVLTRRPVWQQERRPDYLNPKDIKSQPHISRGWKKKGNGDNNEE